MNPAGTSRIRIEIVVGRIDRARSGPDARDRASLWYRSAGLYRMPLRSTIARLAERRARGTKSCSIPTPRIAELVKYGVSRQVRIDHSPTAAKHGLGIDLISEPEPRPDGIRIPRNEFAIAAPRYRCPRKSSRRASPPAEGFGTDGPNMLLRFQISWP